jgi:hypothetical protein
MNKYLYTIAATYFILLFKISAVADDSLEISQETAMAIARRVVGANTLEVIPYSDKDSKHQLIAVLAKDPESICCPHQAKIYLLEGIGQAFQMHDTGLTTVRDPSDLFPEGFPQEKKSEISRWGLRDIDNDGVHEIFSIGFSYGSGAGGYDVQLYDPASQKTNYALISFVAGKPPSSIEIEVKSTVKKKIISDWLLEQSNKLTEQVGLIDKNDETFIWEQNNGSGFYKGKVKLHEVEGQVNNKSNSVCTVRDGNLTWYSYYKGEVYGYDSKRNVHFMLYSPEYIYEWANTMIASKTYLWIGVTVPNDNFDVKKRSLMAYNKISGELELIQIPELGPILCSARINNCDDGPDSIPNGFAVKNTKLTLLGKALTLPVFIKPDELKGATQCE